MNLKSLMDNVTFRTGLACTLAWAIAFAPFATFAQEEAAAPKPDAVLDELLKLDPAALAEHIKQMKAKADALAAESAALRKQAGELDTKIKAMSEKLQPFVGILKALAEAEGMVPKDVHEAQVEEAKKQAMAEKKKMMDGEMAAAASDAPNFADHILPILEETCARCHNVDKQRGGLILTNFEDAMYGGSSGKVIEPGNPGGSRLLGLVMQTQEPKMPPSGDPLTEDQVALIREWIAAGTLANAGAESMVAEVEVDTGGEAFVAAKVVDGPPPMPEAGLIRPHDPEPRDVVARAIAASPTAPLAAVGGDRQILLYDLERMNLLGALPFPEGSPFTLTFSVNGELLVAGGGEEGDSGIAVVWNVRTGERLGEYGKGYDTVLAADLSPDHRLLAVGGPNRVVRVYATDTGDELYKLTNHTDWIYSVKFSPDGELLASADRAGNLLLWQAANGREVETLKGHNGAIHSLAYTIDSNVLASAGADGKVFLWDTWKYSQIRSFGAHGGAVHSLDFNKAGELVTAGQDGLTKRWDLNGKTLSTYENHGDWAYQTQFGVDGGVVLSGAWNGQIAVWQADSGERLADLTTNPNPDLVVATAPIE